MKDNRQRWSAITLNFPILSLNTERQLATKYQLKGKAKVALDEQHDINCTARQAIMLQKVDIEK